MCAAKCPCGARCHDIDRPDLEPSHILVRDEYLERVRPIARGLRRRFGQEPQATPVIRGLHRLALPRGVRVHEALDPIDRGTARVRRRRR